MDKSITTLVVVAAVGLGAYMLLRRPSPVITLPNGTTVPVGSAYPSTSGYGYGNGYGLPYQQSSIVADATTGLAKIIEAFND